MVIFTLPLLYLLDIFTERELLEVLQLLQDKRRNRRSDEIGRRSGDYKRFSPARDRETSVEDVAPVDRYVYC